MDTTEACGGWVSDQIRNMIDISHQAKEPRQLSSERSRAPGRWGNACRYTLHGRQCQQDRLQTVFLLVHWIVIDQHGEWWVNRWNCPERHWPLKSIWHIDERVSWESVQPSEVYIMVDNNHQPRQLSRAQGFSDQRWSKPVALNHETNFFSMTPNDDDLVRREYFRRHMGETDKERTHHKNAKKSKTLSASPPVTQTEAETEHTCSADSSDYESDSYEPVRRRYTERQQNRTL